MRAVDTAHKGLASRPTKSDRRASLRREQWLTEVNVAPPTRQLGGWSAKGQAADKINGHFKRRCDTYTDSVLGYSHDLLFRPQWFDGRFSKMAHMHNSLCRFTTVQLLFLMFFCALWFYALSVEVMPCF